MDNDKKLMPTISGGDISLEEALDGEQNMLVRLGLWDKQTNFIADILESIDEIEMHAARHLDQTRPPRCKVSDTSEWIRGGYNFCVPIDVYDGPTKRVMIRFPFPHKVGEEHYPGNVDEKLRCEAATYAWIHEHCPNVPIPRLWGFALPDGQSFTALENMPLIARLFGAIRRRVLTWLGRPVPCQYVSYGTSTLKTGYLLLDYVKGKNSKMLSESWKEHREDKQKRQNFLRDLSRIILSLGRIQLPKIGSFTIDRQGVLSLTNRPLSLRLQTLEREGIPSGIGRSDTYTCVEPYILDLLQYHSNRLQHQPNAINDEEDGRGQMAAIACLRSLVPHFLSRSLRNGPFVFTLTDIHQSNVFVDDDWSITSIIDLEWACSLPIEMIQPPYWLHDQNLDTIEDDIPGFDKARIEFMDIFRHEEHLTGVIRTPSLADVMDEGWREGKFFFFNALDTTVGLFNIFRCHILPRFTSAYVWNRDFDSHLSVCCYKDGESILAQKVEDRKMYAEKVKLMFASNQG